LKELLTRAQVFTFELSQLSQIEQVLFLKETAIVELETVTLRN